jgi:hypothetical protein
MFLRMNLIYRKNTVYNRIFKFKNKSRLIFYFNLLGIFGKGGEIQTMLCLAFGTNGTTYAGTLSGDIYKWEKNNLTGTVQGHEVFLAYI